MAFKNRFKKMKMKKNYVKKLMNINEEKEKEKKRKKRKKEND